MGTVGIPLLNAQDAKLQRLIYRQARQGPCSRVGRMGAAGYAEAPCLHIPSTALALS